MHDGVADEREFEDVVSVEAHLFDELAHEVVQRIAHCCRELVGAVGFIITYDTLLMRSSPKRIEDSSDLQTPEPSRW